MTYRQMTKHIEQIDKEIEFMKQIEAQSLDREFVETCGRIIDHLCCYKNYLKFEKQWVPEDKK